MAPEEKTATRRIKRRRLGVYLGRSRVPKWKSRLVTMSRAQGETMTESRRARALVVALAISSGLAAVAYRAAFSGPPHRTRAHAPVFAEDGKPLRSLFADLEPISGFREAAFRTADNRCPDSQKTVGVAGWLLSFFEVRSVYAVACTESSCAGHYMFFLDRDCAPGGACSLDGYWFHQSDPWSEYSEGWRWTGSSECNGCRCAEASCTNP